METDLQPPLGKKMPQPEVYLGVQALRFVAALMVVVTHSTLYVSERLNPSLGVWGAGASGVEIFFVISGFVMVATSHSYLDAGGWLKFAKRRIVRIVPMYWIATSIKAAISIVSVNLVLHSQFAPDAALKSLFFIPYQNELGRVEPLLGVGWTLNFEMMFYLLFTIALALRANPVKLIGPILILAAVLWPFSPKDMPAVSFYLSPIVLNFLSGMIIAQWAMRNPVCRPMLALPAAVIGFTILVGREAVPLFSTPIALWIGATALIAAVVNLEPILKNIIPRWLVTLGAASYALYLFHPLIAPAVPTALKQIGVVQPLLAVSICIIVAVLCSLLIFFYLEKPLTRKAIAWFDLQDRKKQSPDKSAA